MLFVYVNCARAKHYYGSLDNCLQAIAEMKRWNRLPNKSLYRKSFPKIAASRNRFNECFKFPSQLIKRILGQYWDSDAKKVRSYSIESALAQMGGFVSAVFNQGRRFTKTSDGTFAPTHAFTRKYFINTRLWKMIMTNPRFEKFLSLETLPCSNELKRMIGEAYANPKGKRQVAKKREAKRQEEMRKARMESKVYPRLQEFVSRMLISPSEAKAMSQFYGKPVTYQPSRYGFCYQDLTDDTQRKRKVIFGRFLFEAEKHDAELDREYRNIFRKYQSPNTL